MPKTQNQKKSIEATLWESANKLRGAVDLLNINTSC